MISVGLLLAASIIGVGVVAAFWNDIVNFMKKAVDKVKELIDGIVYGSKILLQKVSDGVKEISRHYSKVGTVWEETTVTKTVPESQVPKEILERAKYNQELDITDELALQISA